uniref:Uncharacterized protein n=1 Tax=Arundo donax TaxID=35708 RepID=A0A0A9FZ95_ARUDO
MGQACLPVQKGVPLHPHQDNQHLSHQNHLHCRT